MNDFEALYQRHAADVFRFSLYLCGDRAEAEDIASETFIRVWRARDGLRVSTVKAYLFAIARNLYREGLRRHAHRQELAENIGELTDPHPGPAAQAESRAQLAAVLAALQSLPEVDRAALLMRALEEMPYEDIAAALRLSVAAAKVKVHRSRLRLAALCARESGA